MTTYTVINPSSGRPEGRHLNAEDAAHIILIHDGRDYEIRPVYVVSDSREQFSSLESAQEFAAKLIKDEDDEDADRQGWARTEFVPRLDGYRLWSRQPVASRIWHKTVVFSVLTNRAEAEAEIYQEVVDAHWERHPDVMTDVDYDAMQEELARDDE